MKKTFAILLILCILIVSAFSFLGCNTNIKKYKFTHTNGEVSTFEINFDNNTGTYQGVSIFQTLNRRADYSKGNVGMTEKCKITLTVKSSYEDGQKFYTAKTVNADLPWEITIHINDKQDKLSCFILSSGGYTFQLT